MMVIYCIGAYFWMFATAFMRVDKPNARFPMCLVHGIFWPISFLYWIVTGKVS
jgi:hypothetical protein